MLWWVTILAPRLSILAKMVMYIGLRIPGTWLQNFKTQMLGLCKKRRLWAKFLRSSKLYRVETEGLVAITNSGRALSTPRELPICHFIGTPRIQSPTLIRSNFRANFPCGFSGSSSFYPPTTFLHLSTSVRFLLLICFSYDLSGVTIQVYPFSFWRP